MRLPGGRRPGGRHPGKQRPVIRRELRIIRRISRERLHDRAQDSAIEGNLSLTNGDSHEEPKHPLFQTYRLCSRSRHDLALVDRRCDATTMRRRQTRGCAGGKRRALTLCQTFAVIVSHALLPPQSAHARKPSTPKHPACVTSRFPSA
jgi:hypothetical protein